MSFAFDNLAQEVVTEGALPADELFALRGLGWGDGQIHRSEAEAICAIGRALDETGPEWTEFFVNAMTDFVREGMEPQGVVDEAKAQWLLGAIGNEDGRLTEAERKLLVRVVECTPTVPQSLRALYEREIGRA